MKTGANDRVDIYIESEARTTVEAQIKWNVDLLGRDVPAEGGTGQHERYSLLLCLFRREAGTDDNWIHDVSEAGKEIVGLSGAASLRRKHNRHL